MAENPTLLRHEWHDLLSYLKSNSMSISYGIKPVLTFYDDWFNKITQKKGNKKEAVLSIKEHPCCRCQRVTFLVVQGEGVNFFC
jgi:hypothetical protein